jgi:hypothetical protein
MFRKSAEVSDFFRFAVPGTFVTTPYFLRRQVFILISLTAFGSFPLRRGSLSVPEAMRTA